MRDEIYIIEHPETFKFLSGFSSVTEPIWTEDKRRARVFNEVDVMEVAEDLYRRTGIHYNIEEQDKGMEE